MSKAFHYVILMHSGRKKNEQTSLLARNSPHVNHKLQPKSLRVAMTLSDMLTTAMRLVHVPNLSSQDDPGICGHSFVPEPGCCSLLHILDVGIGDEVSVEPTLLVELGLLVLRVVVAKAEVEELVRACLPQSSTLSRVATGTYQVGCTSAPCMVAMQSSSWQCCRRI
jgi:hypothetical protein